MHYKPIHRTVPFKLTSRIKRCFKMHSATVTLFLQNILSIDSNKSFCIKQKPKLEQPAFCPTSWRRERGDLTMVFQDLNSCHEEDRGSLFTRKHTENTRGKKYKLHWEKFHLNRKKNYGKNNHSLEQPLQGCGRALITGNFQYVIGQNAR